MVRTKFLVAALAATLTMLAGALAALPAQEEGKPPCKIALDASVMVKCGEGSTGSGVIVRNGERNFVWTDAHVVAGVQQVKAGIDPATGKEKAAVTYDEVKVGQEEYEGGRVVGEFWKTAKIIRFSEKEDLALLQVHKLAWRAGAKFAKEGHLPAVGSAVTHVGSLHGQIGFGSTTFGKVSVVGRVIDGMLLDQVDLTGRPGSSGGPVFAADGSCLGLVYGFLGPQSGVTYIHPARRIREFAARTDCSWALGEGGAAPADVGVVTEGLAPLPKMAPAPKE